MNLENFPYLEALAVFIILNYIFETTLDLRQYSAIQLPSLPSQLEGIISNEKFLKSKAYSIDKMRFHLVQSAFNTVQEFLVLVYYCLPWLWQHSSNLIKVWGFDSSNEFTVTLLFLSYLSFFNMVIEFPFSLYSTFVIEEKHGFNKQTFFSFIKDKLIGICLSVIIGPPILFAIITIVKIGGPYLAIYLWFFMFSLSLFFMEIYPVVIAPLFNKFTPLSEGSLKTKIENLASSLHFPLKKLFVIDGSRRSSHSNAYMYGFFKNKRIVLFDTLLSQCKNDEEIVAVIAHELGHWKLSHTKALFIITQVISFLQFSGYAYVRNSPFLFKSFGFNSQPVIVGLALYMQILAPIGPLLNFVFNLISRAFEFQADAFASKLHFNDNLKSALVKLQEENLSSMNTDPLYSAYHYSHPPIVERLAALDTLSKKQI